MMGDTIVDEQPRRGHTELQNTEGDVSRTRVQAVPSSVTVGATTFLNSSRKISRCEQG